MKSILLISCNNNGQCDTNIYTQYENVRLKFMECAENVNGSNVKSNKQTENIHK